MLALTHRLMADPEVRPGSRLCLTLPEQLPDQPAVPRGELAQKPGDLSRIVTGRGAIIRGGPFIEGTQGAEMPAVGPFLAVAGPDADEDPLVEVGGAGDTKGGVELSGAAQAARAASARASSHQSRGFQREGTRQEWIRRQHRGQIASHSSRLSRAWDKSLAPRDGFPLRAPTWFALS